MAAIITTHCKLGIVDANGNVTMISIQSTGDDVSITPNSVVSATTVQDLVDTLKESAFITNFLGINDESLDGINVTYSAKMINTKLSGLREDVDEMMTDINKFLPFPLAIQDNIYGYKTKAGVFTAFKSQADIDSAVAAAKVGTAQPAQVLTGYTFTNTATSGLNGSMPNNGAVNKTLAIDAASYTIPAGYHNGSGKVIISPQTKSCTPTTTAQTITADSGKVLQSVSVGTQVHSSKFTPTANNANADMGATHNHRYVDTTTVYNLGYNNGITDVLNQCNTKIPNLAACLRIIATMDFWVDSTGGGFKLLLYTGPLETAIAATGFGVEGSSGRPWEERGGKVVNSPDDWAWAGYVPCYDNDGTVTFAPFTTSGTYPSATFHKPYADFVVYNVGYVRYLVLYIGYQSFRNI